MIFYGSFFFVEMKIKIKKFDDKKNFCIPEYATEGSSGLDLFSASKKTITINPGKYMLIPTNIILEIPNGYEGQIRPRSGLALKNGITVLNSPGTIDSDYRGEVKVLLFNHGKKPFKVKYGERIAQLIISKYERIEIEMSDKLSDTVRGKGGYGSTGK